MIENNVDSPEVVKSPECPLEGSVLVHGFKGNIEKSEISTLAQVITSGSIVSPSQRYLNPLEEVRYKDAVFDKDRITFHTWRNGGNNSVKYVGEAIWAAPTTALEGTIVGDDIAMEGGDVFAYKRGGVNLPLEKGLIYMSDDYLINPAISSAVFQRAQQEGKTAKQWVNENVVVVPDELFTKPDQLLKFVSRRVLPSQGVVADFVGSQELQSLNKVDFTAPLNQKHTPATIQELGDGSKAEGDYISPEMSRKWLEECSCFIEDFADIESDMEKNPLRIEELRLNEGEYPKRGFYSLKQKVLTYAPESKLAEKVLELDRRREELLALNTKILESRYPDMPEYNHGPYGGRDPTKPLVYRDKITREVRVIRDFMSEEA